VWVAFHELDGLISVSKFAKGYFHKSQGWFTQKLDGYCEDGKECAFSSEEYAQLSNALRDIAKRLNDYADAIDAAEE
jgi:hypothetical protein